MACSGDETKKPKTRVPRSMIATVTVNATMMFAYLIPMLYSLGNLDQVTNTVTKLPVIEVYYEATKTKHVTNLLMFMMLLIVYISLVNMFASVSRLIWSFATDKGLPFSPFFARVSTICSGRHPF